MWNEKLNELFQETRTASEVIRETTASKKFDHYYWIDIRGWSVQLYMARKAMKFYKKAIIDSVADPFTEIKFLKRDKTLPRSGKSIQWKLKVKRNRKGL